MHDKNLGQAQSFWGTFGRRFGASEFSKSQHLQHAFSSVGRVTLRDQPVGDDGGAAQAKNPQRHQKSVFDRGRDPSRGRGPHGHALREASGRSDRSRPNFNIEVPKNGYAWWYVDGLDPVSGRAISIIAFVGSVFSPWYRWSGRKQPHNHVCINVATYGPGGRFTMTDRGKSALRQTQDSFTVGPSSLTWDEKAQELRIEIDEISSLPIVSRVRGTVHIRPKSGISDRELALTPDGAHIWRPFAPTCDIDVNLAAKGWQWSGHGYFDANFGTRALEQDFDYWTWGRYPVAGGTHCFYDLIYRDGSSASHAIGFDGSGGVSAIENPPPVTQFKNSLWQVKRSTRCEPPHRPKQIQSLLDAPFYSRAAVQTHLQGHSTTGVFEALDLTRFRNHLILAMLAVRVPRRPRWRFDD